ncbi:deoxyguanosinetriphosphate triphosphohydrolase [Candidatus Venteria ishoeyi]|uniref:Deoxyguanosinetriphosphate triphosphohydrolase-like protein n=1 Tax=Candidatus Venteria ishoeyi TaxID=1899563 RepID=A0A1H6FEA3_9GAMM|nr:deoxyguanosinetriphosphate triphosphohydrolase [Candidatus Venteria ishoeyi]MDM8547290.1 deoxyguanosinetriphosphate triphosphohydrolase [Candidatus Venteria ishoeyi]SEH07355.1 Deoxyguanosinetriphosphate triphosphohydrolase [Candidatus Venteria ishoeyi]
MNYTLAPYAATSEISQGRQYTEAPPCYRTEYQRDRDRIIHSKAFRRLEYKTQVFVNHEGDLFRTRLTHSLEVAQLGRTIARSLNLNEDLVEAIALAHDLGHTPFGHAGQAALNECMQRYGGFEHNLQSLRVVDKLEQKYPAFDGLNLSFETREGILKHCSPNRAKQLGPVAARFLHDEQPTLEAQITNLADEIAYNNHDIDDGLRSGLITVTKLRELPLFEQHYAQVLEDWPQADPKRWIYETIRTMINTLVVNLLETSRLSLDAMELPDLAAVRNMDEPMISFSAPVYEQHLELKRFLQKNLYQHHRVHRMSVKAKQIIGRLFDTFTTDIELLPREMRHSLTAQQDKLGQDPARARLVADYIAGMTDRFAIAEYERLFNPSVLP